MPYHGPWPVRTDWLVSTRMLGAEWGGQFCDEDRGWCGPLSIDTATTSQTSG